MNNMLNPLRVNGIMNKFCVTIGLIPTTYLLSLTYEEQILSIGKYLEDTVYPAINNNAEALAEVQALYSDLKNYVDNYFNELNVQTEINNKIDDMVESGEMAEIINEQIFEGLNERISALEEIMNDLVLTNSTSFNYFKHTFLNNLRNDTNQTILFAGDSIVLGGDPTAQNNFPTVFRNFINDWYTEQNLSAINCGVGGALSERGITDFDNYLAQNPTTIFWCYGTNDITQNVSFSQIVKNLDDFYSLCIENNIELIVIIPPPNFKSDYRAQGMKMLASILETYCKQHGLLYINAYKYITNLYETLAYNSVDLQPDNTHFADYTVLSDAIIHDLIPTVFVQTNNVISNFAFGRQANRIKTDAQFLSSTSISPFSNGYKINNDTTQFEYYFICKKPSILYINSYARHNVGDITLKVDTTNYNINAHNANNQSSDATGYMINIRIPVLLKAGKHRVRLNSFNGSENQSFYIYGMILQEIENPTSINVPYWQRHEKLCLFSGNETSCTDISLLNPIKNCNEIKVLTGTNGANNLTIHTLNMTEPYRYFSTDGNNFKFPICSNDSVVVAHLIINGIANTFSYESTVPIRAIYGYNNKNLLQYDPDLIEEFEVSNNNSSVNIT